MPETTAFPEEIKKIDLGYSCFTVISVEDFQRFRGEEKLRVGIKDPRSEKRQSRGTP